MCIVISVLNGIELSHKLFTPEIVVPVLFYVLFASLNRYWV